MPEDLFDSEINMVKLTKEEQRILKGDQGRLQQKALENIVMYAEALGAEEL